MNNILIGLITIIIYVLITYIHCYIANNRKFKLNIERDRIKYKETFKYLWITILLLVVGLDFLGRAVQYIVNKLC